jgi:hypothetical protein
MSEPSSTAFCMDGDMTTEYCRGTSEGFVIEKSLKYFCPGTQAGKVISDGCIRIIDRQTVARNLSFL